MAKRWLVLSGLWAIPAVIQAAGTSAAYALRGDHSMSLALALAMRIPAWQVWALATPLVLWACRRWPVTRRPWRSVPLHVGLAAVVAFADISVYYTTGRVLGEAPFSETPYIELVPVLLLKTAFFELVVYAAIVVADLAIAYQRRYRAAAIAQVQLEARLVEAQLEALKHQLHPHFLFNTINAISVLMRKGDAASAVRMLCGMSDLLRRSLTSMRVELVSLEEELDFIARYLEIATTRFPDRLRVTVDVSVEARRARVPCMLLQPLVENALEHGIAPRLGGGRVTITARRVGTTLQLEVRDDGDGPSEAPQREGHGVGLSNTRKRLAQLYPGSNRHRFELVHGDTGARAIVEIPFDEVAP
ncbi:MAG TPA: sensor histidine kinase [Kofleriaceae bacterium]|nr:sensor histidine kinase [Kofleriaceae bacterium]